MNKFMANLLIDYVFSQINVSEHEIVLKEYDSDYTETRIVIGFRWSPYIQSNTGYVHIKHKHCDRWYVDGILHGKILKERLE